MQKKKLESLRRKEQLEKLELERKAKEEKLLQAQEERERREHDNFLTWTLRKKHQDLKKRQLAEKERELAEKLKKIEEQTAIAKEIYLLKWSNTKSRAHKGSISPRKSMPLFAHSIKK